MAREEAMTDPKTAWRDADGRFIRRDDERGGLEFNGDLTGAITITEDDALFLLRYLPEALGETGRPNLDKCAACENDADPRFPIRHPKTGAFVFLCDGCPPAHDDPPEYAAKLLARILEKDAERAPTPPADFDLQAASGDFPGGLTVDLEMLKKRAEFDAAIVAAAELFATTYESCACTVAECDCEKHALKVREAVKARRAALKEKA